MRVLVCGGRDFTNAGLLYETLDEIHDRDGISMIIHGDARGADTLAAEWASSRCVPCLSVPANWDDMTVTPCVPSTHNGRLYNKAAGGIRNQLMLDLGRPKMVVAFPGRTGTADMVKRARDTAGVEVREIHP